MWLERFSPLLVLLLSTLLACTSTPLRERYASLDGESKAIFLAYYPDLTPAQRRLWLDNADGRDSFLKNWEVESPELRKQVEKFPAYRNNPASISIAALEIASEKDDEFVLIAKAVYRDGRTADVTEDVIWHVLPELARVRGRRLEFGCLASDVEVTASFLDAREGRRRFEIRKPLSTLLLDIQDSWKGVHRAQELQLKATAHCEDGTRSIVNCQSEWKLNRVAPGVSLSGCGRLRFEAPARSGESIEIETRYGGKSASLRLRLP